MCLKGSGRDGRGILRQLYMCTSPLLWLLHMYTCILGRASCAHGPGVHIRGWGSWGFIRGGGGKGSIWGFTWILGRGAAFLFVDLPRLA